MRSFLKAVYCSDRIPQSILKDRNEQLEILLNEDGDADKDLQENVTRKRIQMYRRHHHHHHHHLLQQMSMNVATTARTTKGEERNVKINQETIIEEKGRKNNRNVCE